MSPCGSSVEEQLSSIMEVLAKAAVSEISQLFSEGSATLRFQVTRSLKENEALRTRMKVMRSELFSLRLQLQTKSTSSRAASRSSLARVNMSRPRTKPLGNGLKPMMVHKAVGHVPSLPPFKSEALSVAAPVEEIPDIISTKEEEEDVRGCKLAVGLKPRMVHKAVGHVPSLPPFKSEASSVAAPAEILDLSTQKTRTARKESPDNILIKEKGEDVRPAVGLKPRMVHKAVGHVPSLPPFKIEASSVAAPAEILDRSTQKTRTARKESPDNILIKEEGEDVSGCRPTVEACAEFRAPSMHHGTTSDAPGSSHMSSHNKDLRIQSVYGKGEGPLVVDGHDNLFTASKLEALSLLSPDHSVTQDSLLSLDSGPRKKVPARGMQDGTGGPGRGGGNPGHLGTQFQLQPNRGSPHGAGQNLDCSSSGERVQSPKSLILRKASRTRAPPVPCHECGKSYATKNSLKIHMRIHTGEKPYFCLHCTDSFIYNKSLQRHVARMHKVNGGP